MIKNEKKIFKNWNFSEKISKNSTILPKDLRDLAQNRKNFLRFIRKNLVFQQFQIIKEQL